MENKEESDLLEILDNLEVLEILELPPPCENMTPFSVPKMLRQLETRYGQSKKRWNLY